MRHWSGKAYAKINLTLDVLGKRADGYHDMDMLMQSVGLWDQVDLTLQEERGIHFASSCVDLPLDQNNLAVKAAQVFFAYVGMEAQGLHITIQKKIPLCAGMAGGSSNAAAVLRGLNELTGKRLSADILSSLGEKIGSDVPYCMLGGTARAQGRGEILTPVSPLPDCEIVLCKPDFGISTAELFHRLDHHAVGMRPDTEKMLYALAEGDLLKISKAVYNVFEAILPEEKQDVINHIRAMLQEGGALGSAMSGTGPTVFGIFKEAILAERMAELLGKQYKETFLAKPV